MKKLKLGFGNLPKWAYLGYKVEKGRRVDLRILYYKATSVLAIEGQWWLGLG